MDDKVLIAVIAGVVAVVGGLLATIIGLFITRRRRQDDPGGARTRHKDDGDGA